MVHVGDLRELLLLLQNTGYRLLSFCAPEFVDP